MRARAAPRAWMSVVSNSGTPVSAGCTSNPITVQPRMTPCAPRAARPSMMRRNSARESSRISPKQSSSKIARLTSALSFSSGVSALRP